MAKVTPITEHFQHFLLDLKESFWGDLYHHTKQAWKALLEQESERQRDRYSGWASYERGAPGPRDYRNGYYERDFLTRFGIIRLRIARTRGKNFLPPGLDKFQRRAPELALLIREAFLRGISTRQVGRVVATLTGETVSAQTVSNLIRDLDKAVREFHQAPLRDEWAYLFLDGVKPAGTPAQWTATRTDAGCLWSAPRRHPPTAGFSAHSGRKPSRLGGAVARSVSPRIRGQEPAADRHRWLSRPGGGHSDGLSAGATPALLGAQDAQYPGESTEGRL